MTEQGWWDGPGYYEISDISIGDLKTRRARTVLAHTPDDLLREAPWLALCAAEDSEPHQQADHHQDPNQGP